MDAAICLGSHEEEWITAEKRDKEKREWQHGTFAASGTRLLCQRSFV
jgi:hypothetical protein